MGNPKNHYKISDCADEHCVLYHQFSKLNFMKFVIECYNFGLILVEHGWLGYKRERDVMCIHFKIPNFSASIVKCFFFFSHL